MCSKGCSKGAARECSKGAARECSKGAARVCSKGAARVCSRGSGRLLEVGLAQLVRPVQQRLAHHGAHARVVVRLGAGAPHRQIERIYQSVRLCQSPPHSYQRRDISIVALLECL